MWRYSGHMVWVLQRLPLSAADDLAALCVLPRVTVQRHLEALLDAGWVVRINLTDPDCGPPQPREPVYALSEPARRALLADLDQAEADFWSAAHWHLRPRSLPDAINSAPIARAAIDFLARLAFALERERAFRLVQVMASPPQARTGFLPWGHYEGRLWRAEDEQSSGSEARFAIHVDRDRLPQKQRRALVRRWSSRADRGPRLRSSERFAPLLVICETAAGEQRWHALCRRMRDEQGGHDTPVMLTATVDALAADWSFDDAIWRRVGSWRNSDRIALASLRWRWEPTSTDEWPVDGGNEPLQQLADRTTAREPLYPGGARAPQRSAALGLKLTRYQHAVIDLLARHPSLSARDLSRFSGVSYARADRECRSMPGGAVVATRAEDGERRYLISGTSLRLTAARAGMGGARKRFATLNSVHWADPAEPTPQSRRVHDLGAYRVVGLLAERARAAGMDVGRDFLTEREWRDYFEITRPLPDGGCIVWMDEENSRVLLVEYERPQRGPQRLTEKLTEWARWYRDHPRQRPLLLVVWDETSSRHLSPPRSIRAMHPHAPGLPGLPALPVLGASVRDLEDGGYSAACWLRPDGELVSLGEALGAPGMSPAWGTLSVRVRGQAPAPP